MAIKKKKRVFISFDFDKDQDLKNLLIGQSKLPDSPFDVIDGSLKEAAPNKDWMERAKSKIKDADAVIVMLGTNTFKAPGVLKEVKMAKQLEVKIHQIIGYQDKDCPGIKGVGVLYDWTWDNLRALFA